MALWDKIHSRGNVEDRRSFAPIAMGGISATGIALLLIFNVLSGGDISNSLDILNTLETPQQDLDTNIFTGEDSYEIFVSKVLGSADDLWASILRERGRSYTPPKIVLFRRATQSACGGADSLSGPHYCPLDETIYLDETFFEELKARFQAQGGDVAEAYVIAHEVGHHAQNQLGILKESSIAIELQADCFAGLWANSIKHLDIFLPGEIDEAMDAAAAVGDDRIQKNVNGYVNPESWTHGSSQQRVEWFSKGYELGTFDSCNNQ